MFLTADLARTAVGLFITLTRQSGTRCQMNLEILPALRILNDSWNNSLQPLLVWPAPLEVCQHDALYKSALLKTYYFV